MTSKQRIVGEQYRAMVTVIKINKGLPTVISLGGMRYTLQHGDTHVPGNKKRGRDSDGTTDG